jgi:hypothetical protein
MTLKNKPAAILVVMLLLMTIALASGCTNEKYNPHLYAKNGTYYNPNLGIKFDYPADWKMVYINPNDMGILDIESDDGHILRFFASEKQLYPPDMTLDEYSSRLIKEFENDQIYTLKSKESKNIKDFNWSILNLHNSQMKLQGAIAFCNDYIFTVVQQYFNDNYSFDLTPIMESLECGEVKNP